jgi:hypothetical protein
MGTFKGVRVEIFSFVNLPIIGVPDHASRIRNFVLVRRIFSSGSPRGQEFGMGREWGGDGNGEISYEQPGTKVDGILSHQGGFPSK